MPLDTNALTTVSNLEQYLGDIDDNLAINLINRASDLIEKYCNRTFHSTAYVNEVYDGTGSNSISLKQYPVTVFTSLDKRNTTDNVDSWTTINSQLYFIENNSGVIYYAPNGCFQEGFQLYRASYTAGYTTIPDDLEEACIRLAVEMYNDRKKSGDVSQESIGDYSITYNVNANTFKSLGLDLILDKYRAPQV